MVYTLCDDLMELIGQQVENIRLEKHQIEHKQLLSKSRILRIDTVLAH